MNTIRMDGTEVCDSFLTQRSYRAAYCEWLVNVTPDNQREALQAFAENRDFSGLRVSGIADLSFLSDFPDLRYLEVLDQKKLDVRQLSELYNLRGLRLETPGTGMDFSWFPELEVFVGDWHADNHNLHECRELRQLRAWQFKPKSKDLASLANTTRLEWLTLTKAAITSLAGLETLEDLRYFELSYAPGLESLDGLGGDTSEIREIEFRKLKNVTSYAPLGRMDRLRRLKLSYCAPMPNLQWARKLVNLDMFTFVETNVIDGDLRPLLALPKLRCIGTMDKKHYSHKCDAFNELLAESRKNGPSE